MINLVASCSMTMTAGSMGPSVNSTATAMEAWKAGRRPQASFVPLPLTFTCTCRHTSLDTMSLAALVQSSPQGVTPSRERPSARRGRERCWEWRGRREETGTAASLPRSHRYRGINESFPLSKTMALSQPHPWILAATPLPGCREAGDGWQGGREESMAW